ncbi:MAG: ATPase [Hyphomicrobiales bacterium]|nr:ATPase [Hyphomicrobiales bacterium]
MLEHLAGEGAFAREAEFGKPGTLDVFAQRNGVSLRVAGGTIENADMLVRSDLARWVVPNGSARRYLEISQSGLAHLRRSGADDAASGFQAQHRSLRPASVHVKGVPAEVVVDAAESPLVWLASRRGPDGKALIAPEQLEAGERLRRDLEIAQMMPRITANWSGAARSQGSDSGQHISDMMIAARQRVDAALDAVGSDCAGVLVDVCGFLKGLGTIEFERAWPRRSAKVVLGIALSALARHYGLQRKAVGPESQGRLHHWGTDDFRPLI